VTETKVAEAMSVGERIQEAIRIEPAVFTINAFGLSIPISDTILMSWIVMAILGLGAWALTRRMKELPGKTQAAVEWAVTFIDDFAVQNMGHHGKAFAPFLGALGLFILTANLLPAFTPVGGWGFEPPFVIKPLTRDINVTAGLAVMIILTVLISGLRIRGPVGWFKHLFKPVPFMVIFNLLEYGIRPLSLSLRLFGNILGAYVLMRLLEMIMPVFIPPVFGLYFDFFDGIIQAVIFVYLSTVYIAEAIE
jgi:F-type H+-transporting ATPase subunit a